MGNDLAHGQLNAERGSWIRNEVQELRVRLKNSEWDSTIRSDFLEFGVGFKNSVWGSRIRSKVVSWNSECTCDPPYALASCPGLCIFDIASLCKRPIFLLFYSLNSLCNPITLSGIRMQVLCFYFSTFRWYFLSFNKRFFFVSRRHEKQIKREPVSQKPLMELQRKRNFLTKNNPISCNAFPCAFLCLVCAFCKLFFEPL